MSSLPPEYTTVRDQLRFEPTLLTDKTRAAVKDKFLSLKKAGGTRSTDHNRALFAGNRSPAPKGKGKGGGGSLQTPATRNDNNSQAQNQHNTTGKSSRSNTKNTGGKENVKCFECGKSGHIKSQCPERICEECGGRGIRKSSTKWSRCVHRTVSKTI